MNVNAQSEGLSAPLVECPQAKGAAPRPWWAVVGRLAGRAIPNLLILAALAGLAFWGWQTGWKLPRFSELAGDAGRAKDDWCEEHAVPESLCVECNPDLLPRGPEYGWCRVHGVHDCPLEHPDVAELKYAPRITQDDLDRARRALDFTDRPANSPRCKLHLRRIQFASDQAVARAGVEVEAAWEAPVAESVSASGEVGYDQTRTAALSAPAPGRVWKVYRGVGQAVRAGDVLALVDAAEAGKAKAAFLQSLAQADAREQTLRGVQGLAKKSPQLVPEIQLSEADSQLREARARVFADRQALVNLGLPVRAEDFQGLAPDEAVRRLQFLGLPEPLAGALDPRATTANLVPVTTPLDGVVTACNAAAGEQADPARPLFVVADTRGMWLTLQVRQEDARLIRARDPQAGTPGQEVRFRPPGADRDLVGEVVWVSTAADETTRAVRVRAELANPDGQLRAGAFGPGRVILREQKKAIVVPSEAVQSDGDCHVVFVRDKNYADEGGFKVFHTRTVRPGAVDGDETEIAAGVLPGEMVVTKGSALLRSELLKNNLGEG